MSESTGKRQSKMNKDTYKMNVTKPKDEKMKPKAWYVPMCSANWKVDQINYAQTEYIWYANKYNKYKIDNWQRTLMKTRN